MPFKAFVWVCLVSRLETRMKTKTFWVSDAALRVLFEVQEFGQTRKPIHRLYAGAMDKFIQNELKGCYVIHVGTEAITNTVCQATFYAGNRHNPVRKCVFYYV